MLVKVVENANKRNIVIDRIVSLVKDIQEKRILEIYCYKIALVNNALNILSIAFHEV